MMVTKTQSLLVREVKVQQVRNQSRVAETQGSLQDMTQNTAMTWVSGHVFGQLVEIPHPNWELEIWRRLLYHLS